MKEHKTTFTCDRCSKTTTINKDSGFPYQEKWCYIYNFEAKTLRLYAPAIEVDVAEIKMKDKHFCSEKCLFEYIKTAFIVEKDIKPVSSKEMAEMIAGTPHYSNHPNSKGSKELAKRMGK